MTDAVRITIITMTIISTLGFILKKVKVTDKRTDKFISVLLVNYITPALMVHTALTQLSISFFKDYYLNIVLAIGSLLLVNFIGILAAKLLKLKGLDRGQFLVMASFSNVVFIGIPLTTGIFGQKAIPYLMLYYVANTVTFWTLGIYQLSKSTGGGIEAKSILKVFNPPIVGFIIAFIFLWNGVSLPNYVMNSLDYLKDLTTPLSLIFMGSTIGDLSFKSIGSPVTTVSILLLRFIISPVIILILLRTFSINPELGKVFIVCAGLPVMTNTALAVERYGGNPSYASFMTALSSILFIFVMPFYIELFTFL